jgi:orotidine-5'-phosphate decarboxylase
MTFLDKLNQRIAQTGSNLCVGLDVRAENAEESTKRWILDVIAQTAPFAAAFKPNSAYFEALGWRGVKMLEEILRGDPERDPGGAGCEARGHRRDAGLLREGLF